MAGRPTKLTPELQDKICEVIRAGNYFDTACNFVGIGERTGYEWLERGEGKHKDRKSNDLYKGFAQAVKKASSEAETRAVAEISAVRQGRKVQDKDGNYISDPKGEAVWQARAWWLERRYPKKYGRQERHTEHSGKVTIEIIRDNGNENTD